MSTRWAPQWKSCFRGTCRGLPAACLLVVLTAVLTAPASAASLSAQDLRILSSALSFMQPKPAGETVVAIVYTGHDTASLRDAEAISAAIVQNLTPDGTVITPRVVEASELGKVPFNLVIVAAGANGELVSRAAAARKALCVTGEPEAVRQGVCVMSIRSTGKIEILVNAHAAQAAGVNFATAFRMMVSEL